MPIQFLVSNSTLESFSLTVAITSASAALGAVSPATTEMPVVIAVTAAIFF